MNRLSDEEKRPFGIGDRLVETMRSMFGAAGDAWIASLPDLLTESAAEWRLTLDAPYPNVGYHYVAPATKADGTPVVLKVGTLLDAEFPIEPKALRLYDGRGIASLLHWDERRGAMLLQRLDPATTLATMIVDDATDAIATRHACAVMRALPHLTPPDASEFITVEEWGKAFAQTRARFGGGTGPLPEKLFCEGESLYADLLASSAAPILLHGDLHQYNILQHGDSWLAIDPKGVLGEPAYEIGAALRNPCDTFLQLPDPQKITRRRLDQMADELGFDRARIRAWGIAQAILSACWSIEDYSGNDREKNNADSWLYDVRIAELIAAS